MQGQTPPHELAAEAGVLGSAMLDAGVLSAVVTNLTPEDFYRPVHAAICAVLAKAQSEGWKPDAFLVHQELERVGHSTVTYGDVVDMIAEAPPASTIVRYIEIVRKTSLLRKMLHAARQIEELAFSNPADGFAALGAAKMHLDDIVDPDDVDSAVWVPDVAEILSGGLETEEPALLTRVDGQRLLYAGRMHTIQGLPSAGKSWIALHACVEILSIGGAVVYVDYEDTPKGIIRRCVQLGAEPSALEERFVYVRPEAGFGIATQAIVRRLCEETIPDLVVIDGVAEAMAQDHLDENSNTDFLAWAERVPRWIVRNFDAAVVMLDHTGKSKDAQQEGRHSRGAGAKLGVIDGAVYTAKTIRAFSRERAGSTRLVIAKDRHGGVGATGETAGVFVVDPKARGERVETRIDADMAAVKPSDSWKPTVLMEMASKELEEAAAPMSRRALEQIVHSDKPKLVREAIARLVQEGYLEERRQGRSKVLHLLKAYRSDGEAPDKPEQQTLEPDDENVVRGPWEEKPDDPLLEF